MAWSDASGIRREKAHTFVYAGRLSPESSKFTPFFVRPDTRAVTKNGGAKNGNAAERLKRIASGCLVLIVCFFAFLGLDNWFGSGPAIREVKQSISSVDSKQFKNASYNDSRIEKLEREVKDLQDEVESLKEKQR